ncbi:hypothetical protein pdam_00006004 [Pocillopora damicornis]|uniref:Uncharacterized protein n=1 Tax=Pocillopora damicornis TaxID=46731 RepID=A0A3M6TT36_POCDA|nr:hypothetical protein pdam_00006004 [Pocillopora damicornis]
MSGAPWSVVEVFDDVDDKLHAFDLLFNEILDHPALTRSIKVRGKPNPYIMEEILGKSTNFKIESLAEENNFDFNNSIFTPRSFPTSEQFTFHSVECKQVEDLINAMPSNKAPGIDKILRLVL